MKLIELKDEKTQLVKKQIEQGGGLKPKIYTLSTGCKVIYSISNGKEHVSISNYERMPTVEEMEFVKNELMKKDISVEIIPPRETNHITVKAYIAHILESKEKIMYN